MDNLTYFYPFKMRFVLLLLLSITGLASSRCFEWLPNFRCYDWNILIVATVVCFFIFVGNFLSKIDLLSCFEKIFALSPSYKYT